jgi:hypothetical protein
MGDGGFTLARGKVKAKLKKNKKNFIMKLN